MIFARVFTAASACVVLGAAVAACSGSFGSGSGLPQTLGTVAPGVPTPSPTPNSTSTILTVGESTAFQAIPEVGGYSAQLAFPKVAPEAPKAAAKSDGKSPAPAAAATPVAIAIGATLSVAKPEDGPDLNFESGKGKKKRTREHPARALAYIKLLPTHDALLDAYPRITLDIPREIASQYRDGEFGVALWNSGEKDAKYRLGVAEIDKSATPPPAAVQVKASSITPAPSSAPTAAATGSAGSTGRAFPGLGGNVPVAGAAGTNGQPTAAPTLPPAHLLFASAEKSLKLVANRPAIFAVYALPHAATPAPEKSPSAAGSAPPSPATPPPAPAPTKSP